MPAPQSLFDVGKVGCVRTHLLPPGHALQVLLVPFPAAAQRPLSHGEHVVCELSYLPAAHAVHVVLAALTIEPPPPGLQPVIVPVVE